MKKMLVISGYTIGKDIEHAGGVNAYNVLSFIHNYFDIDLIVVKYRNDKEYNLSGICSNFHYIDYQKVSRINSLVGKFFLKKDAYMINKNTIKKVLNKIDFSVKYDVIWLHWTQCASFYNYLRKKYPKAKFVLFEEDVMFLNLQRIYEHEKNFFSKRRNFKRYYREKQYELNICSKSNLVICTNEKDRKLLIENGIVENKVCISPSFFQRINIFPKIKENNNIIFYGSMGRYENEIAVIWFLENIFPKLNKNIKFFVVGANPSDNVKKYASDRVIITGFVNSPDQYFEKSFCCICPLTLGAGIKIKSLQALSCGLPLIATDVGIEGIDAMPGKDFILANTIDEFVQAINNLYYDRDLAIEIGKNGKIMINKYFNYEESIKFIVDFLSR